MEAWKGLNLVTIPSFTAAQGHRGEMTHRPGGMQKGKERCRLSASSPGDSHSKRVQLLWEVFTRNFVPALTDDHPGDEIVPHIALFLANTLSSEELVMELMKLMLE